MLTNQEVDRLLGLPKKVVEKGSVLDSVVLRFENNIRNGIRHKLYAPQEPDITFLLAIGRSRRNNLKLSLHFQDDTTKQGMLRLDYNGTHKNPETITPTLPAKFKPYVGKQFDYSEHHMHYHVEEYPSLAWAIPLTDDDFPLKTLNDVNDAFSAAVYFAQRINLQTKFTGMHHELA